MGWFGNKVAAPAPAPATATDADKQFAPGTRIAYDDQLIARFKGHHQTLVKLFTGVSQAADAHDYAKLIEKLQKFIRVLEEHVLEENLRFYIYLSRCLDDAEHREFVTDMKQEMNQISRSVRSFGRHYIEHGLNDDSIVKFQQELKEVGDALTDRVQREEESLYTLYLSPSDYEHLR